MSPRRARTTVPITEPDPEEQTEERGDLVTVEEAEQADNDLAELRYQLGDGAMLTLYRMVDGGEKEFIEQQAVADFSIPWVKERYGGGRYTIYLKKPDPTAAGRWIRQGSKKFRIAGPAAYNVASTQPGAVATAPDEFARKYATMIDEHVERSLKGQELLQQMQMAVLKNLTDRAPDPTIDLLKSILPSLIGKSTQQLSLGDVIALADKMSTKTSAASQMKEMFELVKSAREVGGDSNTPPWMDLASRGLDLLGRAVPTPTDPKQLTSGAPAASAVPTSTSAPDVTDTMHPLFVFLKPQIPSLLQHAIADHDPATYAGVVFDHIRPEHFTDVLGVIDDATFLATLTGAFPAIGTSMSTTGQPVSGWFEELRVDLVDRIREATGGASDDEEPQA